MDLLANIKEIKYKPFLCHKLEEFDLKNLKKALDSSASFILKIDRENKIALSWWVSAKRTRSYPYARVYDTLSFAGKKVTIIPVYKDEGLEGDRDFLQWDTISLMSLLGIYVIVAYYCTAEKSKRYKQKITKQRFDLDYIHKQINNILSYQSDALHWNLSQIDNIGKMGRKALTCYAKISKKLKVKMHSEKSADKKILKLAGDKNEFMKSSRLLAEQAQIRERLTVQPKENLSGLKAIITIKNFLGGNYFFTVDEVKLKNNKLYLVEGKHSQNGTLPSIEDIKDGLIKMILFTNLVDTKLNGKKHDSIPVLKLTTGRKYKEYNLNVAQKATISLLEKEAEANNFEILLR